MMLQTDGDLQIGTGEVVTVAVTARNTHYLAIFSDLQKADWTIVQPVRAIDASTVQEIRSFVAGAPGLEGFALTFDFVRNQLGATNAGAQYLVQMRGSQGLFTIQKSIVPIAPFPVGRPFVFEVV